MQKTRSFPREKWWYILIFLGMFLSDKALPYCPLSVGLSFALNFAGFSPFPLAICSVISLFFGGTMQFFALSSVASLGTALVFSVYRKRGATAGMESLLFLCFFILPYVIFGGEAGQELTRAVYAGITLCYGVIGKTFLPPLLTKRGIYRPTPGQLCLGVTLLTLLSVGVYRAFGSTILTALSTLLLLFGAKFFKASGVMLSGALVLPRLLAEGDFWPLGVFFLGAIIVYALTPTGRFFTALCLPALYFFLAFVLGAVPLSYAEGGAIIGAAVLYLFTPKYLVKKGEEAIAFRQRKTLTRSAVNRERQTVSASLNALSTVFREIQGAVAPAQLHSSEEEVCSSITAQAMQSVCVSCPAHGMCVGVGKVKDGDIYKTVAIGLAKGRVSVLDLSGETARTCAYQNNLLFCINNLLSRYRQMEESKENAEVGKKLLAEEAGGVAEVLEKLSASYAVPLIYDSKVERAVYVALAERGVFPAEIMAQKGGTLSLLLSAEEGGKAHKFAPALSRAVCAPLALAERIAVTPQKCVAVYRPKPKYGIATGLAIQKKAGSPRSGDTHSLLKVGTDQILIAISDGMGSGDKAGEISTSAIGLIESFYRAGFSSDATLSAVNRLLSARAEENFAALDIATLSLSTGKCVFLKIGAPYGFVIKREGALVVEGNSLPLGILDDIAPQAYTCALSPGDTVILVSDGVSDAFRSASDFLDFVAGEKGLNPQVLADSVLARAKELTGGECKDDMTVLCVRLFENGG
ncbi:MAG: hypothetical protein E7363_06080 [Clostridiales bacterium]|nr:hypothetical protein [Clostridiales bacterium]